MKCPVAALGLLLLGACAPQADRPQARVRVRAKTGVALERLAVSATQGVRALHRSPDQIEIDLGPGRVALSAPGACPVETEAKAEATTEVELVPWLRAQAGDVAQVGYDAPFTLTLTPGCREALAGRIDWRQTAGPEISTTAEQNGFVLRGKTRALVDVHPEPLPWGIVPLSPRTRGDYEFEAIWRSGTEERRLRVKLASAARATGLPSIAIGQRVVLGGAGWHVRDRARGGHAEVESRGGLLTFAPDVRGRWVLEDAEKRSLAVVAGTHDSTPLDCGRSECHAREVSASEGSPMQNMLQRGLAGALGNYDPECALGCHTAGEPGLADGGFSQVLSELGLPLRFGTGARAWDDLPRPLRRLGGVTCTACHGPGAIPEETARWAILRVDVCATCHDAPPRYAQVRSWSKSRMARADRDPEARRSPECRACHTTAGFLASQGVRKDSGPPASDPEMGIGCAACHAAHGAHLGRALLRDVRLPELEHGVPAASRVCVTCHSRSSSAASLVFGGKASAHAQVWGGCLGCHGSGERGGSHDFAPNRTACGAGCHAGGIPSADAAIAERARRLYEKLGGKLGPRPPHATPTLPSKSSLARDKALIVLEDPAAAVHNAAYARSLLDEAEGLLR